MKNSEEKKGSTESSKLMKLFVDELKDIYWAENKLTEAIPKMAKKATDEKLVKALEDHLAETKDQISRLDKVFKSIDMKPEGVKCEAMAGLVKEGEEIMKECDEGAMRDAGIISAAQKVEHYEIASYGTLCQFAERLGLSEAKELLGSILEEEKAADEKLTQIAVPEINREAAEV